MNRIYKSIFNEQTGTYVAVSENTKNKGKKGNKVLAATALSAALGFGAMGSAQAQLVSACAGVSLPRSVVTDIVGDVLVPVVDPIETTVNGLLGPITKILVAVPGVSAIVPEPLSIDLTGILKNAANGDPIRLDVLNQDGEAVAPSDDCNLTADSLNLTDPAGIAIGGNTITGLGSDAAGAAAVSSATDFTSIAVGNFSQATQSKAIAFGEAAQATGVGSLALGADARANAANSVALGAGSVATQADTISVGRAAGTDDVSDPGLTRRITHVAKGVEDTDAVNVGQLDAAITNINTSGLVRQPNPSDDITVGQETQGVAVDFSGSTTTPSGVEAYDRKLTGVKAGDITNADSNDAVTGGQLYTTNKYIADALGGGAAVNNLDGTLKAPEYELTYGTPGLTAGKHDNVGSVLGELAGHVGSNAVNIANNTNTINQLLGGAEGIVKYDDTDPLNPKITVGNDAKFDDATSVDFTANNDEVRKLTGLAAGELSGASTDAVTGAQLFTTNTNLGKTLGVLGASIDSITGEFKDPEYKLDSDKTTEKTVGGALSNLDGRITANTGLITNIEGDIQSIINGETGIVKYDVATKTITVGSDGPAADAEFVSFAGAANANRKLTGIANGKVEENGNEAVTGGQLFTTNKAIESALGGKDASGNTALKTGTGVLDDDGNLISPTYTLTAIDADGDAADVDTTGVGGALYSLNTSMGNVNSIVNNLQTKLNSGTIGLVQQDGVTHNITVGANTNGTIVDFAGKDSSGDPINRTLSGVAAGTADTDAVNVEQWKAAGQSVANALGGGATVGADGTVTTPTYQLDDGKGNKIGVVGGVEGAFKQLDGRVAANTSAITRIDGDINTINETITKIEKGGAGIVKYDQVSETITVGSEVVARSVDFAGKDATGAVVDRKLTGVAAGTKANHAVNRQQLDSVAAALGGAKDANGNRTGVFNDEGDFTNPLYELNNVTNNGVSTTETTKVTGVGSALTHLNDSVVSLQNQVNSSIGLIQQPGTGDQTISIGGNTGGTVINIAGTDGDRQITGVAAGTAPNHAVNKQQLDNTAAALRGDIRRAEKRSEAGIAAATAVATLGQAYQPGQSAFSMGGGTWRGETGYAVGLSTVSENGKWLLKGAVSGSGRGGAGGGASVTYLW
ncbi:MAG: ESPR-type extended signal peptide-containing protein [Advenella sp.]|uniref:ESPR-type extended signal peptide-containing protein n=1 Tax=Advenella sp. TaxID=1872388 RepID=UPI0025876AA0|nr:ESPR-type extended signal peptide-containing protein [Advenella sp.]MDD3756750.1 ESPR-type extended signal peptide-containing protein [Advenella sp.]